MIGCVTTGLDYLICHLLVGRSVCGQRCAVRTRVLLWLISAFIGIFDVVLSDVPVSRSRRLRVVGGGAGWSSVQPSLRGVFSEPPVALVALELELVA